MKVLKPQNNKLFSLNFDKVAVKSSSNWQLYVNFRTYTQIHTPTVVQGGTGGGGGWWMELLPGVFDMLHYFETILPLILTR